MKRRTTKHTLTVLPVRPQCLSTLFNRAGHFSKMSSVIFAQSTEFQLDVDYYIDDLAWSPDGELIAVSGSEGLLIYTSELQQITQLQQEATSLAGSLSWKPDSSQLASVGNGNVFIWQRDQSNGFTLETTLQLNHFIQILVSWSPDGLKLASQDFPNTEDIRGVESRIHIWDTTSWTIIRTLPEHYTYSEGVNYPFALDWSTDSTQIAGAGFDRNNGEIVFISDVITGERSDVISEISPVSALSWHNSGRLAIGSYNLSLYDTTIGQFQYTLLDLKQIGEVHWSPDGTKLLLINDSVVEVRDSASNGLLATLPNAYAHLKWSPDGSKIATASMNTSTNSRSLQIWNVSNLPISNIPTLTPYATLLPTQQVTPIGTSIAPVDLN
jgi:Tol biopolymer transport system component